MSNFEFEKALQDSTRKRCVAELKLQSTVTLYQAYAMEGNNERCAQIRSEIHALQDIILDCIATQMFCIGKING